MNAEFARRGVDAVAVSADVAPADLGGFAEEFEPANDNVVVYAASRFGVRR